MNKPATNREAELRSDWHDVKGGGQDYHRRDANNVRAVKRRLAKARRQENKKLTQQPC